MLLVALDALDALLKCDQRSSGLLQVPAMVDACDGLEKLELLQEHENHTVYTKAVAIIETYFGAEEEVRWGRGSVCVGRGRFVRCRFKMPSDGIRIVG